MTAVTKVRTWELTIPAPAQMCTENTNKSRWVTGPAVKAWREASFTYAKQAKLPKGLTRVRIDVVLHCVDNRGRDTLNMHKFVIKPLVDGLCRERIVRGKKGVRVEVGYGLVPDDNPRFVDGPHPTIGAVLDKRRYPLGLAVVTITDLGEG